ncbi:MAG: serine/threonine-protein kinase, partial [Candidatus Xenobia bacterium]
METLVTQDRYRVLRTLKEGNGVTTALAEDTARANALVVLKTAELSSVHSSVRMRLEHEADVLRSTGLGAPELAIVPEENRFSLALPYVSGQSLSELLANGPRPVLETVGLAIMLLEQLHTLHSHGVLHRDIKPANIHVAGERASLIDFGLSRSARLNATIRDQPVGSARYMAPEQAGLLAGAVDERSDLYSLGLVLFECLAGRPAFTGERIGDLLRQHLTAAPPELRTLNTGVPRALEAMLQRLMRKDPRDRYQSAQGALADLNELKEALQRGVVDPALTLGAHDRRGTLTEPAFVGRTEELAELQKTQAQGGLVLLEAESGGGKSRLLEEFAAQSGVPLVLHGQGLQQAAQRPFQLLVGVAEGLLAADLPELRRRVGMQAAAICSALPELRSLLWPEEESLGPEAFGENRTIQALSVLLDSIGPALILLDDCQWADDLTVRLLHEWHHNAASAQRPVVVAAFRSEEVPDAHPLRRAATTPPLQLHPLARDDMRRLVESMAGPVPDEVIDAVARLAEGSPFMATAALRGLVENGALYASPGGWSVDAQAIGEVQASYRSALFLSQRLQLLPPPVRTLLAVGAVLGKQFEVGMAAELAVESPALALESLNEARRRHLVWLKTQGEAAVFVHDKVREAVLQTIPLEEARRLHQQAADLYERNPSGCAFELAWHFDQAGLHQRALPYALQAADQARARHALGLAESQYRIAERGATEGDAATRGRIAEGLGEVLMLKGSYDEAQRAFDRALEGCTEPVRRASLEGKIGELAFKRGDVRMAAEHLETALRQLGRWVPQARPAVVAGCLWEGLVQAAHTLLPTAFLARRSRTEREETSFLAMRLYSRLAYAYWFGRGLLPCTWAHLHGMNLAELYPVSAELAQAWSEHAPAMTQLGAFSRGIDYVKRSRLMREQLGDVWGQGQSCAFHAVILYSSASFEAALRMAREAVRILERTGDMWEVHTARWHIALCLYRLGDLEAAVAEARKVHESAAALGDQTAAGIALGIWSKAAGGRVPADLLAAALQRPVDDVHTRAELLMGEARRLMAEGRPHEAVDLLQSADDVVVARGLRQEYVAPILPWLLTALRLQRERTPHWMPHRMRHLLDRSEQVARRALRVAGTFQANLPHALREVAWLHAARGRAGAARQALDRSVGIALRQGAQDEVHQSLAARVTLGYTSSGGSGGETASVPTPSLAGRSLRL